MDNFITKSSETFDMELQDYSIMKKYSENLQASFHSKNSKEDNYVKEKMLAEIKRVQKFLNQFVNEKKNSLLCRNFIAE